jgi:hypothetical protein
MAADNRPGFDTRRLVRLMSEAVARCCLDLKGFTVLTEAASGPYAVTPVLAAMAGAQVWALSGNTQYATGPELEAVVLELARQAGVADRVQLSREKTPDVIGRADIVTNSGQVRPIDAAMVGRMKSTAVIPLMYESWEYRLSDVDLDACLARGIPVAGTNESHPSVEVLTFVGPMAIRQLHDAGVAVYRSRIVLLCDNSFAPVIGRFLRKVGAEVIVARRLTAALLSPRCDAVLLALRPTSAYVFAAADAAALGAHAPGTALVQFWGDADREALTAAKVPVWPPDPPRSGHMGVLPSAIGPAPVVRLQTGGLKVGELLARGLERATFDERDLVQMLV